VLLSVGPAGTDVLGPYGRAGLATLIALVLFGLPPIVTNGYVAVREVPADVREAARGMGMRGMQVFRRVELPLALPLVMAGLRLALVQIWATATIAALVAGPGLGNVITAGFYRNDFAKSIAGAVVVAVVALVLELIAAAAQRFVDPQRATHAEKGWPRLLMHDDVRAGSMTDRTRVADATGHRRWYLPCTHEQSLRRRSPSAPSPSAPRAERMTSRTRV
jgi:ABC-type Fe3+ transport system permease subunit